MKATHLIWRGAGSPAPCDAAGVLIEAKGDGSLCAACGEPGRYRVDDAISDNFTTVKNSSRAWSHGGSSACAACVFCCRTLRLKTMSWFATESVIYFVHRRGLWDNLLDSLLSPPPPPFVAGYPLTGISKGGQSHGHRAWWPGLTMDPEPLIRLQSKHVALYARVATSRERYPLQVDDQHDVVVDVPLWTRMRGLCAELIAELRSAGVGATDIRGSLVSLRPPSRCPMTMLPTWRSRVLPFVPHHGGTWWPLFVDLLKMPELPPKEPAHATTRERDRSNVRPENHHELPPRVVVPVASNAAIDRPREGRGGQVLLPFV